MPLVIELPRRGWGKGSRCNLLINPAASSASQAAAPRPAFSIRINVDSPSSSCGMIIKLSNFLAREWTNETGHLLGSGRINGTSDSFTS